MSSSPKKMESPEIANFKVKLDDLINCLMNLKGQDLLEAYSILRTLLVPHLTESSFGPLFSCDVGNSLSTEKDLNSDILIDNELIHSEYTGKAQKASLTNTNVKRDGSENYIESLTMTFPPSDGMQSEFDYCIPYHLDGQYISFIKSSDAKKENNQFGEKYSFPSVDSDQVIGDHSEVILDLCSKGKLSPTPNKPIEIEQKALTPRSGSTDTNESSPLSQVENLAGDKPANLVSVIHKTCIDNRKVCDPVADSIAVSDLYESSTNDHSLAANAAMSPGKKNDGDNYIESHDPSIPSIARSNGGNSPPSTLMIVAKVDTRYATASFEKDMTLKTLEKASPSSLDENINDIRFSSASGVLDLARRKHTDPPDRSVSISQGQKSPNFVAGNIDIVDTEENKNSKESSSASKKKQDFTQPMICSPCGLTFSQKQSYRRHLSGHKRNRCSLCTSEFAKHKELNLHMKQNHNVSFVRKTFSCQFCDRYFLKKISLYYHLKCHVTVNQKVCQKCGEICDGDEEYDLHIADHVKNTAHQCEICKESFKRKQQYQDHMKGHAKNKCEYCDMSFSSKKALFKHSKSAHNRLPQKISLDKKCKCEKCGAVFCRPSLLQMHMKRHLGLTPYECLLCNKQFNHSRSLRKHLKSLAHEHEALFQNMSNSTQSTNVDGEISCEYCGLTMPSLPMLRKHCIVMHNKAIIQKCIHCEYKTKNIRLLKRHMDVHLQEKKYMCEICGNSFKGLDSLKGHYAFLHSDERHFKCLKCEKAFKNKSGLMRHEKTHFNNRPHKCHCGSRYNQLSNLKRHLNTVHGSDMENQNPSFRNKRRKKGEKSKVSHRSSLDDFGEAVSLPLPATSPQGLTVLPQIPTHEEALRESGDFLLTSGDTVLMTDSTSGNDPTTPHFAVLDPQLFHFIPSFQLTQDNLHTVSFVGGELHTLSIAPSYSSTQTIEDGFSVSESNMDPNLSHSSHNLPTSTLPLNPNHDMSGPVIDFSVSSPEKVNLRPSSSFVTHKEDSKSGGLDIATTIGEGDLNFVPTSLQELGYADSTETGSLPTAGYIVQQSLPSEILHSDIIF